MRQVEIKPFSAVKFPSVLGKGYHQKQYLSPSKYIPVHPGTGLFQIKQVQDSTKSKDVFVRKEVFKVKTSDMASLREEGGVWINATIDDFWKNVGDGVEFFYPIADGALSRMVRDIPCLLREIIRLHGIIGRVRRSKKQLEGITTPYIYYGFPYSSFGIHTEDMNYYSVNWVHYGYPKIFWTIRPDQYDKAIAHLRSELIRIKKLHLMCDAKGNFCPDFVMHNDLMPTPEFFLRKGIAVYQTVVWPGQMILLAPKTLHWGFNTGYNIAEAVNFVSYDCFITWKTANPGAVSLTLTLPFHRVTSGCTSFETFMYIMLPSP